MYIIFATILLDVYMGRVACCMKGHEKESLMDEQCQRLCVKKLSPSFFSHCIDIFVVNTTMMPLPIAVTMTITIAIRIFVILIRLLVLLPLLQLSSLNVALLLSLLLPWR